ncbi:hypothetical protein KSF_093080 [Reticulibacter mediterranei]|uniref:Uncharacterized protein n=1 Tax=Reticulibacter mediterranei TaxID=2778369 RepID=A0A8J3IVI5_9CHLR|nr:hypothetical protein KSF_093080 [Reticulibacter mediterranei]
MGLEQLESGSLCQCLGATPDAQLTVDIACVDLDCADAQHEAAGDFTIGKPLRDQVENFKLSLAQRFE